MLGNMKFFLDKDILLLRFAHSWDILANTRNKFHISTHPCIILVVVVVVKTLFKSHTLTSSTISWFPRGACELHRKIHNLNTTYIYTGQIAHLRCAMLRKQAYVSIKSMQKFLKPNRKVDCANVSDLEGI